MRLLIGHAHPIFTRIGELGGVFLGGGEPGRLLSVLSRVEGGQRVDTPVMAAIRELLHRGGLVAGTRSFL